MGWSGIHDGCPLHGHATDFKAGESLGCVCVDLVEWGEKRHFPIPLPSPIEAIKFRMEQQGLRQRDLIPYIGRRNRVSEVLSGKRRLTLPMIRALVGGLGIPAIVLIQATEPPDA